MHMSTVLQPANPLFQPASNEFTHNGNGDAVVKFGVVGYGYWGPNVVRNLDQIEGSEVLAVCDKSPASRKRIQKAHPHVTVTAESADLMTSPDIDAIAVITPVWTHYELAKAALE